MRPPVPPPSRERLCARRRFDPRVGPGDTRPVSAPFAHGSINHGRLVAEVKAKAAALACDFEVRKRNPELVARLRAASRGGASQGVVDLTHEEGGLVALVEEDWAVLTKVLPDMQPPITTIKATLVPEPAGTPASLPNEALEVEAWRLAECATAAEPKRQRRLRSAPPRKCGKEEVAPPMPTSARRRAEQLRRRAAELSGIACTIRSASQPEQRPPPQDQAPAVLPPRPPDKRASTARPSARAPPRRPPVPDPPRTAPAAPASWDSSSPLGAACRVVVTEVASVRLPPAAAAAMRTLVKDTTSLRQVHHSGFAFAGEHAAARALAAKDAAVLAGRCREELRERHRVRRDTCIDGDRNRRAAVRAEAARKSLVAREPPRRFRLAEVAVRQIVDMTWRAWAGTVPMAMAAGRRAAEAAEQQRRAFYVPRMEAQEAELRFRRETVCEEYVLRERIDKLEMRERLQQEEVERGRLRQLQQQRRDVATAERGARHERKRQCNSEWREVAHRADQSHARCVAVDSEATKRKLLESTSHSAYELLRQDERHGLAQVIRAQQRVRRQERDGVLRKEAGVRSELRQLQVSGRNGIQELEAEERGPAKRRERLASRQRERLKLNKMPPKLQLENFDPRRKVFGGKEPTEDHPKAVEVLPGQLWPRATIGVKVALPSFLRASATPQGMLKDAKQPSSPGFSTSLAGTTTSVGAEEEDETAEEWIARKSKILSGSITLTLDTSCDGHREEDSLDLVDPLTNPALAYARLENGMINVRLHGRDIATVIERSVDRGWFSATEASEFTTHPSTYSSATPTTPPTCRTAVLSDADSDTESQLMFSTYAGRQASTLPTIGKAFAFVCRLQPDATIADVQCLVRACCVRRQLPSMSPPTRVNLTISLTFPGVPKSGGADGQVKVRVSRFTSVYFVPPYINLRSRSVVWTAGEGDAAVLPGVTVTPPVSHTGERLADCWGKAVLRARFLSGVAPDRGRDALFLLRRRPPVLRSKVHTKAAVRAIRTVPKRVTGDDIDTHVAETLMKVTSEGADRKDVVMATIVQQGTLRNSDQKMSRDWDPTPDNTMFILQLEEGLTSTALRHLLSHLVYRNDAHGKLRFEPRVLEVALTDAAGDTNACRVTIQLAAKDQLTTIRIEKDFSLFRRIIGDTISVLRTYAPQQPPVHIAADACLSNPDVTHFKRSTVRVTVKKGGTPYDRIVVAAKGDAMVSFSDPTLLYDDAPVGTAKPVRSPQCGSGLVLSFSEDTSLVVIEAVTRTLAFVTDPVESARARPKSDESDVISGEVKEGIRTVELSYDFEGAEPVTASVKVKVTNCLLTVPVALQSMTFTEDSEAQRLASRYEVLHEALIFDGGFMCVQFMDGYEDRDVLDLRIPDGADLVLGPPKDDPNFERECEAKCAAGILPRPVVAQSNTSGIPGRAESHYVATAAVQKVAEAGRKAIEKKRSKKDARGDQPADELLDETVRRVRDRLQGVRRTFYRDIFSVVPGGGKVPIATCLLNESRLVIFFKDGSRERDTGLRRGTTLVRKRDVLFLLRCIHYQHRSDNPRELRKVVQITLNDARSHSCCSLHMIHLQAINDATQIHRTSQRALVYRQGSVEDLSGYAPFDDVTLFDPDSGNFSEGMLSLEQVAGGIGDRGAEILCFLTPAQQRARGLKNVYEVLPGGEVTVSKQVVGRVADPAEYRRKAPMAEGGIGNYAADTHGLRLSIKFAGSGSLALSVVEEMLRAVRYRNVSRKMKPGNIVFLIRVNPGDDPDGKLKVPLKVYGPLLTTHDGATQRIQEGGGPVTIAPRISLSMGEKQSCTMLQVSCRLTDPQPGDQLGLSFRDSPLAFKLRLSVLMERHDAVGEITENSKHRIAIDLGSPAYSKCTGRHLQGLLRCFTVQCKPAPATRGQRGSGSGPAPGTPALPALDMQRRGDGPRTRKIEFAVALPDAQPYVLDLELKVEEHDSATRVALQEMALSACVAASAMQMFPEADVLGDVVQFRDSDSLIVEVEGSRDGKDDTVDVIDLNLPTSASANREGAHRKWFGWNRPMLSLTPKGILRVAPEDQARGSSQHEAPPQKVADVSGRGTGCLKIVLVDCSQDALREILRSITYRCTRSRARSGPARRIVNVTLASGREGDTRFAPPDVPNRLTIDVAPCVVDVSRCPDRVDMLGSSLLVMLKAHVTASELTSFQMTAHFVATADDVGPCCTEGWRVRLCCERTGVVVVPGLMDTDPANVLVERQQDRVKQRAGVVSEIPGGMLLVFDREDHVTPKVIEKVLRALEVVMERPHTPVAHLRIVFEEVRRTSRTQGPRDSIFVLTLLSKASGGSRRVGDIASPRGGSQRLNQQVGSMASMASMTSGP